MESITEKKVLSLSIGKQSRLLTVRNKIRTVLDYLEIPRREQNRLIIALSELMRNTLQYAKSGELTLSAVQDGPKWSIAFVLSDRGPGIAHLDEILQGAYRFPPGRGLGILSAKRLLDEFEMQTVSGKGTQACGRLKVEHLYAEGLDDSRLARLYETLSQQPDIEDLVTTLREKEQLIEQLNNELSVTNEGIIALYREIDEKNIELSRVNQMKSSFLASMSHELRTPLNSILALSQILLDRIDGDLSGEQQKQVAMIQGSGEQLLQLINDILDLSRIEAGKVRVEKRWIDLHKVAQEAITSMEPLAKKKRLTLRLVAPPSFPPVFADEARVRQILLNLLSNAVKFTPSGGIHVTLAFMENGEEEIAVSVQDTGIGIAQKNLVYIFEPFHQIDSTPARKYGGTGLGLSICKQLVELMGGRIWANSELEKGSTFTFTLPMAEANIGTKIEES
ncbi:MAG: histidine kinase [Candidatus Manganitrophaceae bacterium]|nr:MAG: histidine kinase [Candidatus Manganitrophaceae bacterium]